MNDIASDNEGIQKMRSYFERHKGNPFADISSRLFDIGLSLDVPKPMTPEILQRYYDAGVIQKKDLKFGEYYWGRCRNASLAMWDGSHFVYIRIKSLNVFLEKINHIEDDDGYDLFVPIKQLTFIDDVN